MKPRDLAELCAERLTDADGISTVEVAGPGFIMEGKGRWAKHRGLLRTAGHKRGAEVFSDIADYCDELGVSSVYYQAHAH